MYFDESCGQTVGAKTIPVRPGPIFTDEFPRSSLSGWSPQERLETLARIQEVVDEVCVSRGHIRPRQRVGPGRGVDPITRSLGKPVPESCNEHPGLPLLGRSNAGRVNTVSGGEGRFSCHNLHRYSDA